MTYASLPTDGGGGGDVRESARGHASLLLATVGPLVAAVPFFAATRWLLRTELGRGRVANPVRWTLVGVVAVAGLGLRFVRWAVAGRRPFSAWGANSGL